jgi:hypothetical protein
MKIAIILFSLLFAGAVFASVPPVVGCGDQYSACGKPGAGPGVPNPAPPRTGRR